MLLAKLHLDPGETILLEVRRHWFVFLWHTVAICLGALLPIIIFIILEIILPADLASVLNANIPVVFFLYMIWLLLMWIVFFIQWTNFYLDVWYITEKRIIDVEQKGMFHREVSNLRFDKIQDVSIEVRGILATFLNFGDIHVQTAAEDSSDFKMKVATAPERVRDIIFSRHNKEAERNDSSDKP